MPNNDNKPLAAWNMPPQGEAYELPFTERSGGNVYELPAR
jgi:hypothetical protein